MGAHLAFLGGVLAGSSVGGHGFPGDDHHTAGLERDVWEPSLDVLRGQLGDGRGQVLPVINLAEAVCRVQVRQERRHCPEGRREAPRAGFSGRGLAHGDEAVRGDLCKTKQSDA